MLKKTMNIIRYIYFSIIFIHYYLTNKMPFADKQWSAISSAMMIPFLFVICLHFSISHFIGRERMNSFNSIFIGECLLILLILINSFFFVLKSKYIKIEEEFSKNKSKLHLSFVIYLFYMASVLSLIFSFSN